MKKRKFRIIIPLYLFFISALLFAAYYMIQADTIEGEERQKIEEELADEYIEAMAANAEEIAGSGTGDTTIYNTEVTEETKSVFDYSDDNYYNVNGTIYTPDYAQGYIDCVLEIPSISLRRGVYSGTWEDIRVDLDLWMTVAARPDYVLNETHYCIYGHNHTVQDLSFNRLKDVQPGDYFILTKGQNVYFYAVTNFFAEWRSTVTRSYVDNFDRPSDHVYIFTCGRDQYRYKDICVEGTLYNIYDLNDWLEHRDEYVNDYLGYAAQESFQTEITTITKRKSLNMTVQTYNDGVLVNVTDPDGHFVDVTVALFDKDGIVIENDDGVPMTWQTGGHQLEIYPIDEDGNPLVDLSEEYILGVYENDTEYNYPTDWLITFGSVDSQSNTITIEEVLEEPVVSSVDITRAAVFAGGTLFAALGLINIVFQCVQIARNRRKISASISSV